MTLDEIKRASDSFTDEVCTPIWVRSFVNQALGVINLNLGTSLPLVKDEENAYDPKILPNDWQYTLLVTYVNWGVKMNDTSLNEADRYLQEFYKYLALLKSRLDEVIPEEFQKPDGNGNTDPNSDDGLGGVYRLDTHEAINWGWFGHHNRGGN